LDVDSLRPLKPTQSSPGWFRVVGSPNQGRVQGDAPMSAKPRHVKLQPQHSSTGKKPQDRCLE
jgi:hypothetical protein